MKITLITIGSRGDVQPFMALGLGLQKSGHKILLATHVTFEKEIRELGMDFAPIEGDIRQLVETDAVQDVIGTGSNPFLFSQRFMKAATLLVRQAVKDMLSACNEADAAVLAGLGFYGGYDVCEKLGIPFVIAAVQPLAPTSAFGNLFFPTAPRWLPFAGVYNRATFYLFNWLFWSFVRGSLNNARSEILGLRLTSFAPPFSMLAKHGVPSLYGVSPAVIPHPSDWADCFDMTGYWFLDSPTAWSPPSALADFIEAGSPPVYIGFGSLFSREAEAVADIALRAIEISGQRGILLTGWGGMKVTRKSEQVFFIESAPHSWLFPRMSSVVHHGGAGTTAAGLRAGIPTVIVPFMGDQLFWGRRVRELGVGAAPIPRSKLTPERLAESISTVIHDEGIRSRAQELGQRIHAEDGVARAVEKINDYFRKWD